MLRERRLNTQGANVLLKKKTNLFKSTLSIILAICLACPVALFGNTTEAFATDTDEKLADAQSRLDAVTAELEQITSEIDTAAQNVADTTSKITEVNEQIEVKQAELEEKQETLGNRMASKYRSGDTGLIDLILSSGSFNDLVNNWFYAEKIMEQDNELINDVKTAKEDLNNQKKDLEALQVQQNAELQSLQSKQNEVTELVSSLDAEVQELLEKQESEKAAALAAAQKAAQDNNSNGNGASYTGQIDTSNISDVGQRIVAACYSTPGTGYGWCAAWVSNVYANAGVGRINGNACDMFYAYCTSSDLSALQPGMIIACGKNSYGLGQIYGHVGIYIGNGMVMSQLSVVTTQSLDSFIQTHGTITGVRWGFPW